MQFFGQNILVSAAIAVGAFLIGLLSGWLLGRRTPEGPRQPGSLVSTATRTRGGPVEIYVGNLAASSNEDNLREVFERYGKVQSVRVIANRANGESRVFAFVSMTNPDEAEAAIRALQGKTVEGRKLVVNEARAPRRRGRR